MNIQLYDINGNPIRGPNKSDENVKQDQELLATFYFNVGSSFLNESYSQPITITKDCERLAEKIGLLSHGPNPSNVQTVTIKYPNGSEAKGSIRWGTNSTTEYYQIRSKSKFKCTFVMGELLLVTLKRSGNNFYVILERT